MKDAMCIIVYCVYVFYRDEIGYSKLLLCLEEV